MAVLPPQSSNFSLLGTSSATRRPFSDITFTTPRPSKKPKLTPPPPPPPSKRPPAFQLGQRVEVRSDEEGFAGAWYTAVITDTLGLGRYVVEYETLLTEDEERRLQETTTWRYIRPCPRQLPDGRRFKAPEKVDVWCNEGWWEGEVSKRLGGGKYAVYFESTEEEIVYDESELRLHLDWVSGLWVLPARRALEF